MKTTNITKGDWMVSNGDQIVSMPSQCKIANRISGWTLEEVEANAKLMAAAPDMMQGLAIAKEFLDFAKSANLNLWSDKMQLMYQASAKIDSAFKKATE